MVLLLIGVLAASGLLGIVYAEGLFRVSMFLLTFVALLLLLVAVRALVVPRRRRVLPVEADGTTTIRSPATLARGLVLAWLLMFGVGALWLVVMFTDFDAIEAPGATMVTIVGLLASLPDFLRLLRGRLHRWELTLGPDGYRYRGYRTNESLAWSKVRGARIQARKPAGVRIDRRGNAPDLVVPIIAFDVPPEQIVEEIQARVPR